MIVAGFAVYYIRNSKKNKARSLANTTDIKPIESHAADVAAPSEVIEQVSRDGVINALVMIPRKRKFGVRHVELIQGKQYGRQWHYLNYMVFWLCETKTGALSPVIPTQDMDHTPGELYEAISTKSDIGEVFEEKNDSDDKVKVGYFVLAICVIAFLAFMSTQSGG